MDTRVNSIIINSSQVSSAITQIQVFRWLQYMKGIGKQFNSIINLSIILEWKFMKVRFKLVNYIRCDSYVALRNSIIIINWVFEVFIMINCTFLQFTMSLPNIKIAQSFS